MGLCVSAKNDPNIDINMDGMVVEHKFDVAYDQGKELGKGAYAIVYNCTNKVKKVVCVCEFFFFQISQKSLLVSCCFALRLKRRRKRICLLCRETEEWWVG